MEYSNFRSFKRMSTPTTTAFAESVVAQCSAAKLIPEKLLLNHDVRLCAGLNGHRDYTISIDMRFEDLQVESTAMTMKDEIVDALKRKIGEVIQDELKKCPVVEISIPKVFLVFQVDQHGTTGFDVCMVLAVQPLTNN